MTSFSCVCTYVCMYVYIYIYIHIYIYTHTHTYVLVYKCRLSLVIVLLSQQMNKKQLNFYKLSSNCCRHSCLSAALLGPLECISVRFVLKTSYSNVIKQLCRRQLAANL